MVPKVHIRLDRSICNHSTPKPQQEVGEAFGRSWYSLEDEIHSRRNSKRDLATAGQREEGTHELSSVFLLYPVAYMFLYFHTIHS